MDGVALRAVALTKEYPRGRGRPPVHAVRGVSFELPAGGTAGIVGESGCGKSTLARLLVGLEAPTSGTIEIGGVPLVGGSARTSAVARKIQLVFQDPFSSLDPRLTVADALGEVLRVHHLGGDAAGRDRRIGELLDMVALGRRFAPRYPHELSGGQAQRVAIARALAVEPGILVLDEPTSALDVSVRAEIMNLLVRLQGELDLAYVFISHDLGMVRHIAYDVDVMYLGRVVEAGPFDRVLGRPLHPYTRALADAVPVPDPEIEAGRRLAGRREALAVVAEPATGCPYHPRCPLVEAICREVAPDLVGVEAGHRVACHVAVREAGLAGTASSTATGATGAH
jgi:oligopeptide/dipeptide ABC transporter ATP-binding protein